MLARPLRLAMSPASWIAAVAALAIGRCISRAMVSTKPLATSEKAKRRLMRHFRLVGTKPCRKSCLIAGFRPGSFNTMRVGMDRAYPGQRPVVLVVEDEVLIRTNALRWWKTQALKPSKLRTPTKRLGFWRAETTSERYSPMFRCLARWMASDWRALSGTAGHRRSHRNLGASKHHRRGPTDWRAICGKPYHPARSKPHYAR